MKSKFLPVLLVVLMLLNGALIFMLINKSPQKNNPAPSKNFLSEQLQFSKNQKIEFNVLDENHRRNMMDFEHEIIKEKDVLFNFLNNETIDIDSISSIVGDLEAKKELEIFSFFKSVRKICTKDQQEKFDDIIKRALRKGNQGPPNNGDMPPPPRDRDNHPPPR